MVTISRISADTGPVEAGAVPETSGQPAAVVFSAQTVGSPGIELSTVSSQGQGVPGPGDDPPPCDAAPAHVQVKYVTQENFV